MQFNNITELQTSAELQHCFETAHQIGENTYRYTSTKLLGTGCLFLYEHAPSEGQDKDSNVLVLGWNVIDNEFSQLQPSFISVDQIQTPIAEDVSKDNIIGDVVNVKFTTLPGGPSLKGKVDTGADISSLHADKWSVQGNQVHIQCSKISPNVLTLPLRDQQAVKSVSGVQYRPVVEMTVRINDRLISNVLFNIADRASMDYPVLVGKNILERGKFLIDPSLTESNVEWLKIAESLRVVGKPQEDNSEKIKAVYEVLKNNNVDFADLLEYIKGEVTKTFDDIKY